MSEQGSKVLGRREVLKSAGVATLVAASTALLAARRANAESEGRRMLRPSDPARAGAPAIAPAGPEVLALFGPIQPGTRIGRWTVRAVHGVRMGAIPVVLASEEGEEFQVDVLRRDNAPGAPAAVGQARTLSVFVVNGGSGSTATLEEQGLGAMALAEALARREDEGAAVPALLTLRERTARFPRAVLRVLG